mmetsp:Transcript_73093/g.190737  ORF Transcript_73093/g.190737 Transcript_73093/m.190737 type:complete len:471 (-) Transcript_73093:156-1568(-)
MITRRAKSWTGTPLYAVLCALFAGQSLGWLWPAAEAPSDRPDDWDFGLQVSSGVYLIDLDLHKIPVYSGSELAGFRVSYTGTVRLGLPRPQEFRVLFDSGSGQLIVPSSSCVSEVCLKHSRYNVSDFSSSRFVQMDGRLTPARSTPEQVMIQFGQGQVRGQMVRERVCAGRRIDSQSGEHATGSPDAAEDSACVAMNTVIANELSASPWAAFPFDGIVGLGLPPLSLTPEFSFFGALHARGLLRQRRFGMYLAESGEGSELALGGINPTRVGGQLQWTSVVQPEQGHWQVDIVGVHIGGRTLDVCRGGGCRGVIDTGTSQLAVPSPHEKNILEMLTMPAGDIRDCRFIESHPPILIELGSFNITLQPEDYMRQLPAPAVAPPGAGGGSAFPAERQEKLCKPRIVGVNMPTTIGAKTFILGQPLLHRYYTVYDFEGPRVGFALAVQGGVAPRGPLPADAPREAPPRSDVED